MMKMTMITVLSAAMLGGGIAAIPCAPADAAASIEGQARWYHVRARLRSGDDATVKGKVEYRERERRDALQRRVQIHIQRGDADTTYDVVLNDAVIGTVRTNEDGEGKLYMRSYRAPRGRWDVMPDDFPILLGGDVMEIGDASGDVREK